MQSFKFRVRLDRSTSPGPTLSAPPKITLGSVSRIAAPPGSAPAVAGAGAPPAGAPGSGPPGSQDRPPAPDTIGTGAFQECTGLEMESDVREYLAGGRNDQVVRRVGRAKYAPVVLKRGMLVAGDSYVDATLWNWLTGIVAGDLPVPRYDGAIEALDPADVERVLARWTFTRALPSKLVGPQLNARTGEISVEEVTLQHEGIRMEPAR